jgi:hypothetical protein
VLLRYCAGLDVAPRLAIFLDGLGQQTIDLLLFFLANVGKAFLHNCSFNSGGSRTIMCNRHAGLWMGFGFCDNQIQVEAAFFLQ